MITFRDLILLLYCRHLQVDSNSNQCLVGAQRRDIEFLYSSLDNKATAFSDYYICI